FTSATTSPSGRATASIAASVDSGSEATEGLVKRYSRGDKRQNIYNIPGGLGIRRPHPFAIRLYKVKT
ncbi:MAG: hypothetical protein HZA70_06325, partial [Planctomycetes bacterium]|nr:hypothetical protein [Planctomycetota bacterium]